MFGIDIDELSSVFDANASSGTARKKESVCENKDTCLSDEQLAEKKKKAEELLQPFLKRKVESDHVSSTAPIDEYTPTKKSKWTLDENETELKAPRITIHKVPSLEGCMHEVAVPPETDYRPLVKSGLPPAKTYPFILDSFQKEAIHCIDNNQSVMISAHTSAGKTVVGEYAIATAMREKQRVIYTTPIKALSNQKYREFMDQFGEVGLLTGDVTLNPNASVLIMTTEILQSMLYRGSSVMREVGWVVFDEIHYMRDKERGVVWEETLVLLPDSIRYVFLSATIPNARQFAEWIASLHRQPCHVVSTDYRPVPLRHYIYPVGGEGLFLVMDEGRFIEDNFDKAMRCLGTSGGGGQQRGGGSKQRSSEGNVFGIVRLVKEKKLDPAIVFSFSKKECEIYALQMAKLDFNAEEEKRVVDEVFRNAIGGLSEEDRHLPQVESVLPLLRKGIGIHHSGLLPILKETVEILFSEGLIKCLFATETFAMGLNMPARTVLYTSVRKYDGSAYRWISSNEYIQMSGRAGRRGKDDSGTVIMMIDESMGSDACKQIIQGNPDPLNSAFHLTYNMLLNLLRVEEINPEYMMERSFSQFQNYAALPALYEKARQLRAEYTDVELLEDAESVESYHQIRLCLNSLLEEQWAYIRKPQHIVPFMQAGRLIRVQKEAEDFGWGVVVNLKKQHTKDRASTPEAFYVVECLLRVTRPHGSEGPVRPLPPSAQPDQGEPEVICIRLHCVRGVSAVRLFVPTDLRPRNSRLSVLQAIEKARDRLGGSLPLLDPVTDMRITDEHFVDLCQKVKAFEERLENHWLHGDPRLDELLRTVETKEAKLREIEAVHREIEQKRSLIQMEELKARKRVLRRLKFCTEEDVIELKGRVACEITGADELLLTELLFDGVFNPLTTQQTAALLSCLVFEEKSSEMPGLSQELAGPLRTLQTTARTIARVSTECRLPINEDVYVESFRPHMMDIVAAWVEGATFSRICSMTDIFEGNIIRSMRRLEELLRQMANAARTMGNCGLEAKFTEAILKIKRDIVFAASLYL